MRLYTKVESLLAPEFVVRSFSGLAADFFMLPDRGYLREGWIADVSILDPERYRDLATFQNPRLLSEGIVHVLVNGSFAIRGGESTQALAGVPIPRPF
jgi:N-acyl-D-aspartate/D-glutamate deacylase